MILQSNQLNISNIMSTDFVVIKKTIDIKEMISILIKDRKEEILISNESDGLIGIITIKDLHKIYNKDGNIADFEKFIYKDIITGKPQDTLLECRDIMLEKKIGRLPILKNEKIVGIIRQEHIRDHLYMGIEQAEIILEYIINNIQEAICVIDAKGKVVIWNHNAEKLYKIPTSEIYGKYLTNYFPDSINASIIKTKKPVKNVFHTPRVGTDIIISAAPIYINNKFIGVVSTDRDVSEINKMQRELHKAKDKLELLEKQFNGISKNGFSLIIGNSKTIKAKVEMAKKVANTNASVLITGESGTGKEVFARAMHEYSDLNGVFVSVNSSAIPSELFESEFFGYEEGAFTGAKKGGKPGLFELANEGTLFLDEIGDLPLSMQAKLLRVLQEKKIQRVGGEKLIDIQTRIISATNKNLEKMVKEGKFREDLYYRINVIKIHIPALRERKEDITLLFQYFLNEVCNDNHIHMPKVDSNVMDILMKYDWKGNIRELKNTVEHMVFLNKGDTITVDLLPGKIKNRLLDNNYLNSKIAGALDLNKSIESLEISLIKKALDTAAGNKSKAAKLLNIPRTTLHSKLNQYKIK